MIIIFIMFTTGGFPITCLTIIAMILLMSAPAICAFLGMLIWGSI